MEKYFQEEKFSFLCVFAYFLLHHLMAFPDGSVVKNPHANVEDMGSIPGLGRSPGEGDENPLNILVWEISWTEEPGRRQPIVSQKYQTWLRIWTTPPPLPNILLVKRSDPAYPVKTTNLGLNCEITDLISLKYVFFNLDQ